MICQITFKCRSKVHPSCSNLYTTHILRYGFHVFTSYIMNINWTAKGVFVHILWVGCCGIPLHAKNSVDIRRRIGNFRFVCSFCVDFLVSEFELEIGIAIGFRWRWWNAALTDEPVNWPTSRLCVCRTGQATDRPTEYVRPCDRLTDRENPFTLRQFNWIHHFEGDTLSMQLLRFVFTSGTAQPIHIRRAGWSQHCQWFVLFQTYLNRSIRARPNNR